MLQGTVPCYRSNCCPACGVLQTCNPVFFVGCMFQLDTMYCAVTNVGCMFQLDTMYCAVTNVSCMFQLDPTYRAVTNVGCIFQFDTTYRAVTNVGCMFQLDTMYCAVTNVGCMFQLDTTYCAVTNDTMQNDKICHIQPKAKHWTPSTVPLPSFLHISILSFPLCSSSRMFTATIPFLYYWSWQDTHNFYTGANYHGHTVLWYP
jgi:hypothetical protein